MSLDSTRRERGFCLALTDAIVGALRTIASVNELITLMEVVAWEMDFRHYALIHHDIGTGLAGRVDLKDYPAAITEHLFGQQRYRRDPVIRGCAFADSAFLWSDLSRIMHLDRNDRASFALGAREGLNEGITVPYVCLGERMGSCTFAGTRRPENAHRYLGAAQMIGIFAFQSARRLVSGERPIAHSSPRLHPRPRDCVVLAGRGFSNKEIARALCLTPRTVDGYLTEARRLFDAHDRTELVVSAVLAGEVGLHELARRQPE
ncbi:helix-turn-helix transcriptional regulator [Sphingobium nicotianae]|uniref:Autoinducer binding domain-containing protein n=1 Tax=Sphingobium nicotianae TaxID=2782607 RepID=A0A9X1DFY4_9SPHN|nr:LuxR family transcriptional regulator [Sphingobium nicotianae]MBT2189275.1 autoinducer binding domain-containing protein [Sphingobium nicotianae]